MNYDAELLASLVGKIYEAAVDRNEWSTFLKEFGATLDSHVGMVWAHDFKTRDVEVGLTGDFGSTQGISDASLSSFEAYFGQRNVWLADERLHTEGSVVIDEMLYPGAELVKTEYFADWLRPQDIRYTAAAIVERRDDRSVNVTLARSERAGPYRSEELRLFQLMMPHFKTAFQMHQRLHRVHALSAGSCNVLEAMPFGVVLLDSDGRVLHATYKAQRLAERSGRVTFLERQPPRFASGADASKMSRHIAGASATATGRQGGAGGLLRLLGRQGVALLLNVVPLPLNSVPFGVDSACAVFISEEGQTPAGSFRELLTTAYGLSPIEARLAEALVNGETVKTYADENQVAISTARTQVQAIMKKTGVARQADLVRVILTGPAVLQWPDRTRDS